MNPHVFKVGDKATRCDYNYTRRCEVVLSVEVIAKVGKRLKCEAHGRDSASEYHVPIGGYRWEGYGSTRGGGHLREWQPGDDEKAKAAEVRKARDVIDRQRDEAKRRAERARIEERLAVKEAEMHDANVVNLTAEIERLDAEIAALERGVS